MKRTSSIEALLKKAIDDEIELRAAYDGSLQEQHVREDLKVVIKNIFENLRSCLDYIAHDIFETHCGAAVKPSRLSFPIKPTAQQFTDVISKDYPGLQVTSPIVYAVIESVQPYQDSWLGQFNKLNNHNKHQDLVEQTRTEARHVTASSPSGTVTWGPGAIFGSRVKILGVPINPETQMPIPNSRIDTRVSIWVDFRFKEIDQPVLPFVKASIANVERIFRRLQPHI